MRGDFPLSFRGSGVSPGKIWEIVVPEKRFTAFLGENVRFLNLESQLDIHYAAFCFNFSLFWCCSWQTK